MKTLRKSVVLAFAALVLLEAGLVGATSPTNRTQSDLRNAFAVSKVWFTKGDTYSGLNPRRAERIDPFTKWTEGHSPAGHKVDIQIAVGRHLLLVARSSNGRFFSICDDGRANLYGKGHTFEQVSTFDGCSRGGWKS